MPSSARSSPLLACGDIYVSLGDIHEHSDIVLGMWQSRSRRTIYSFYHWHSRLRAFLVEDLMFSTTRILDSGQTSCSSPCCHFDTLHFAGWCGGLSGERWLIVFPTACSVPATHGSVTILGAPDRGMRTLPAAGALFAPLA